MVRCLGPGAPNLLCTKLFLLARFLIRKARFSEPVFGILQRASVYPKLVQFSAPPVVIDEVCGQENRRGLGAHAVRFGPSETIMFLIVTYKMHKNH